jgi:hypothetical protein
MTGGRTSSPPGWLRTLGPTALAYILATALTGAYFWGDSVDYAEDVLDGSHFWDFGHLFWRPLGTLLAEGLLPLTAHLGAADDRAGVLMLLRAVCWLSGLGCLLLLRAMMADVGIRPRAADLATLAFLLSQAFLNYVQTAASYIPGLFCLLLGCRLLLRAAGRPESVGRGALGGGVALAGAVGFWFPYVWALPAAGLLPLLVGLDRARLRLTVLAAAACAIVVGLVNAAALAAQGIGTVEGARAWVAKSAHGIAGINGVPRMLFGLARSFIYLGEDGTLFRRYLGHDPLNPVTLLDLARASLWQIGLFYLFMAGLVVGLARSARGRRLLALLAVAAVPTLAFAVAWQGGDMERYLALYPFLFLALAFLLGEEGVPRLCQAPAVAFFAVAAIANVQALARPVLERRHGELSAQAAELASRLRPHSRVFTVNDEVAWLRRNFPLDPLGHRLPMEGVGGPCGDRPDRWRAWMRERMLQIWESGGDVWVTRRLLSPTPRAEWLWVEDQRAGLRWAHLHGFFRDLEADEPGWRGEGYVRILPTAANRERLARVAPVTPALTSGIMPASPHLPWRSCRCAFPRRSSPSTSPLLACSLRPNRPRPPRRQGPTASAWPGSISRPATRCG